MPTDDILAEFMANANRSGPLTIPWPHTPNTPTGFRTFESLDEWRQYVNTLSLAPWVWSGAMRKYQRAQKLYLLGWFDGDLIMASELVALTALELALRERYMIALPQRRRELGSKKTRIYLRELLEHMVEGDGLSDDKLPCVQKYGGSVVSNLYETEVQRKERTHTFDGKKWIKKKSLVADPPMTLDKIRDRAAHGDPFDSLPRAGLLEVIHDLIEYASRDRLTP